MRNLEEKPIDLTGRDIMDTDEPPRKHIKMEIKSEPPDQGVNTSGVAVVKPVMLVNNVHSVSSTQSVSSGDESKVIPPRRQREFIPEERKDNRYWDKRRRNNEAAKRSREKRRIHDYAMEQKIKELTDENTILKKEMKELKQRFGVVDESGKAVLTPVKVVPKVKTEPNSPPQNSQSTSPLTSSDGNSDYTNSPTVANRRPNESPAIPIATVPETLIAANQPAVTTLGGVPSGLIANPFTVVSGGSVPPTSVQLPFISPGLNPAMFSAQMNASAIGAILLQHSTLNAQGQPVMAASSTPMPKAAQNHIHGSTALHALADAAVAANNETPLNLTVSGDSKKLDTDQHESRSLKSPLKDVTLPQKIRQKLALNDTSSERSSSPNTGDQLYIDYKSDSDSDGNTSTPRSSVSPTQWGGNAFPNPRMAIDPKYAERRRRNNEAARKCRENKKMLVELRTKKTTELETENSQLRSELQSLTEEVTMLKELILKKKQAKKEEEEIDKNQQNDDDDEDPPN